LNISNTIPESFRLFVPHEKSELSAEKTIQTTCSVCLARYRKLSILATRCCVILIFSTLQGNSRHYGHFQQAGCLDFRSSKVC